MNFQTMVVELTGLEIANASLLDEATAAAEALYMSHDIHKKKKKQFFVSKNTYPQTIEVIKTRAARISVTIIIEDPQTYDFEGND